MGIDIIEEIKKKCSKGQYASEGIPKEVLLEILTLIYDSLVDGEVLTKLKDLEDLGNMCLIRCEDEDDPDECETCVFGNKYAYTESEEFEDDVCDYFRGMMNRFERTVIRRRTWEENRSKR